MNAESGGNVVVVHGDLLHVELKGVQLHQFTQGEALQRCGDGPLQTTTL